MWISSSFWLRFFSANFSMYFNYVVYLGGVFAVSNDFGLRSIMYGFFLSLFLIFFWDLLGSVEVVLGSSRLASLDVIRRFFRVGVRYFFSDIDVSDRVMELFFLCV